MMREVAVIVSWLVGGSFPLMGSCFCLADKKEWRYETKLVLSMLTRTMVGVILTKITLVIMVNVSKRQQFVVEVNNQIWARYQPNIARREALSGAVPLPEHSGSRRKILALVWHVLLANTVL